MSAVDRMGGFRGLVIGLFRLPVRSAFSSSRLWAGFRAGGKRFSFVFSAPPKGGRKKTKQNRRFRLGFPSSFLFCFP
jgi:hypothetical protein